MSKGTQVRGVRIPPELQAQLERWIEDSLTTREAGPWTLSSLILAAIQEKLDKRRRSNQRRNRKVKPHGTQETLLCEECQIPLTLDCAGQFTNDPICGWVAQCWDCLNRVGPFNPAVSHDIKDS